ncbi:tripartite tricarboxylate transporter TctB family protein [Paramicrobacterium chengjingii]|uniref:tripartite tricarboxylate transporter TctB family protein n=1 Tax=Paramicrobacterium chengjingii TaxID=2769067 RepID=UPI00142392B2|nr:tripartite tricarboxylate transporter TctB family protein [Microbacterium chengjingii]
MTSSIRTISIAALAVVLIGILCIIGGLTLPFMYAGSLGPAWLPLVIGILCIVCAVVYWFTAVRADETINWTDRRGWLTIGGIFGSFVVFLIIANLTLFALGAFVFIVLFLTVINAYLIVKRLIIAALSAAAIHVLFVILLQLPLPGAWR